MTSLSKWLFIIFCFFAAMASYSSGSTRGFGFFMLLGALFELGFWFGIIKLKNNKPKSVE